MAGGVNNIDLSSFIIDSRILGQDGDPPLPFNVIGIHDPLGNLLILAEYATLLQELVHQSRLAVVNMGDDRDITDIFSFFSH